MNDDLHIVSYAQCLIWTLINTHLLRLPLEQVFRPFQELGMLRSTHPFRHNPMVQVRWDRV